LPVALAQVVENGNFVSLIQQQLCANTANIARAANNKDFHWREKCRAIAIKSKRSRAIATAVEAACR